IPCAGAGRAARGHPRAPPPRAASRPRAPRRGEGARPRSREDRFPASAEAYRFQNASASAARSRMAARLVRRRPLRYGHRVPGRERHRAVLRVGLGLLAVSACKSPPEKATPAARGEVATPPSVAAKSVAEAPPVSAAPPAVPAPPSSAEPTPAPPEPRVYVKARFVWIRPTPSGEGQWLGFLWTGSSVRLKSTEPRSGPGCRTFYAI